MNLKHSLSALLLLAAFPSVAQQIKLTPKVGFNQTTVSSAGFVEYTRTPSGSDQAVTVVSPYGIRDLPTSSPILTREPYSISRFQVGFGLEKEFNSGFSLETGLSYTQKGFRTYTPKGPGFSLFKDGAPSTQKADYLEVPLLARVNFGSSRVRWFANAGPYAAYWLRYGFETEVGAPATVKTIELSNQDFSRLDLGVAAGIGMRMQAGTGELTTELRYTHGLRNQQQEIRMPAGNGPVQNQTVSLLIGYALPLSR